MADIVLLTTPTESHTLIRYLGPYQIAWFLRKHSYEVQVLDFLYFMNKEQRLTLFKKFITPETKIIGFAPFLTGHTQRFENGVQPLIDILDDVKEYAPWAKIIVGGVYANTFIEDGYINFKTKVDAVFHGEAEYTFLEYVNYVFNKGNQPGFTLINNQKVYKATKEFEIHTCDMKFHKNDFILPNESLPLEMSRGCIFMCKFCRFGNLGKDKDTFNKSIESIRETLISNYELFGTTKYTISDDTMNSHRERTIAFHRMVKKLPFKIEFIGYVRLDLLDIWPEQREILPDSGLVSCHFGVESFDPISCKQIGKGWGATKNKSFLTTMIKEWGNDVLMRCTMIAGLGQENKKDWQSSYDWLVNSGIHDWQFNPLDINRNNKGSIFDREAELHGYKFRLNVDNKEVWYSDTTTFEEAVDWCQSVEFNHVHIRKPTAWMYMAYSNLGFSKEEIFSSNYAKLSQLRKAQKNSFVDQYYDLILNTKI